MPAGANTVEFVRCEWISHFVDDKRRQIAAPIYAVDWHPSGTKIATGGTGPDSVKVWNAAPLLDPDSESNVEVPKHLTTLSTHIGNALCVRWSPGRGTYLASGSDDKLIILYTRETSDGGPSRVFGSSSSAPQVERYVTAHVLRGHALDVFDVSWSHDATLLASSSADCTTRIWSAPSFACVRVLDTTLLLKEPTVSGGTNPPATPAKSKDKEDPLGFVKGVAWDPVGKYLAVQSDDKSVVIWSVTGGPNDWRSERRIRDPYQGSMQAPWFSRLSWSPDGTVLATAGGHNARMPCVPLLMRSNDWKADIWLVGHMKPVEVAKFNPHLFRPMPGAAPNGDANGTSSTAPTPEGNSEPYAICATASEDGSVAIWRSGRARPVVAVTALFKGTIHDLSWSPDGLNLAAVGHDGTCASLRLDPSILGEAVEESEVLERMAKFGRRGPGARISETPGQVLREEKAKELDAPALVSGNASTPKKAPQPRVPPPEGTSASSAGGRVDAGSAAGHPVTYTKEGRKRIQPTFIRSLTVSTEEEQPEDVPQSSTVVAMTNSVDQLGILDSNRVPDTGKRKVADMDIDVDSEPKRVKIETIRVPVVAPAVNLPAPPIQRRIMCRFAPRGPAAGTATDQVNNVEVLNPSLDKGMCQVRCMPVQTTKDAVGGLPLWEDNLPHAGTHVATGDFFVAVATVDGGLWAYSVAGRRILPPIVLESRPVFLDASKDVVMVVTQNGGLYTWNVHKRRCILDGVSVTPVLTNASRLSTHNNAITYRRTNASGPDARIEIAKLMSPGPVPVVATSDLSAYAYDSALATWIRVAERPAAERALVKSSGRVQGIGSDLAEIASEIASRNAQAGRGDLDEDEERGGPLGKAREIVENARKARAGASSRGWVGASRMTFGMVENYLASARSLQSPHDYLYWLREYARKLAETVNLEKVEEVLNELAEGLDGESGDTDFADDDEIWGNAVKQILPILSKQRAYERKISAFIEAKSLSPIVPGIDV
ncbi:WD40 repeat-like protein [Gonapodya prolifera JEL478]|uniref:Protein HIR n=1 Tax=Gonapodya prolifera (strain JEL478) TaxID=1344416 RepID=A0A139AYI6_GONPJ|nr:WD40 repeat-like protein [Gonapodya prolifera JEL478]|eukprot:KXS21760.1 WD40 repeat-like protein [Gonapodya prolifera JEL478]